MSKKEILILFLCLLTCSVVKAQTNTHTGDTYIKGNIAVGDDVTAPITFGRNTLILKENNIRLLFDDTSNTLAHPNNDWSFTINDITNGGANFFRIDDVTGGLSPFKLLAGSRNNALVTKNAFVGFGTDDPRLNLHVVYGDTPGIRLEQDVSSGWSRFAWDIAGNDANFFIKDVQTNKLPFRIAPNQEQDVLTLRDNKVGIGTWSPAATLHVKGYMRLEPVDKAPATPGKGDLYFDKTTSRLKFYEGSKWLSLEPNPDESNGSKIIKGDLAIGDDATAPITFGRNTLILKENNIRVLFDDTSNTLSHPNNDWSFSINDADNDGDNFFRIDDVTGGFSPFKLLAGSRNNALVTKNAFVGFGTDNPLVSVHVVSGDTPGIRFEQDASDGWSPISWDIAGNDANFFIKDVQTNKLPFRVGPKQEQDVLTLRNNKVGIGTWTPSATLHVKGYMRLEPGDKAPETPGKGDLYFDKTTSRLKFYEGTNWLSLEPNTDAQELSITTNVLSISGSSKTINLSTYLDNTDAQALNLTNDQLSISNSAKLIDLSIYKDNTDSQQLSLTGNELQITGGNKVDLSTYTNTDAQSLTLSGDQLSISNSNKKIDLSAFKDNTDAQQLSLTRNELQITGGNKIDLSSYTNTDAQNISFSGTSLSIDNGNTVDLSSLKDGFEANTDKQELGLSGNELSISNSDKKIDLSVFKDNTDAQQLSLTGSELQITGGNKVDLSAYTNTDAQNISFTGTTLSIDNGNTVDLSSLKDGYEANTDKQELSLSGNQLSISNSDKKIDLSVFKDNTDAQQLSLTGSELQITGGNKVDLSAYTNTDAQNISFTGTSLSIDNGNTVDLSSLKDGYEANTDKQELSLSGNQLSISNSDKKIDLSAFKDNTDAQSLALSGDQLSISNSAKAIDLSVYKDNTDAQQLSLTGNELQITGGNKVDLSTYTNTDAQKISFSGTSLSIDNGNIVDLSSLKDGYEANTDKQELSLSGNQLSISNSDKKIDLSVFKDNTDAQQLSLTGNELQITGGNKVDLSAYTNIDAQNISFTGTSLSIDNGNTVDLSSLKDGYEANTDKQELSLSGNELSISNSDKKIDLSAFKDNTDAQSLTLSGDQLSISNSAKAIDLSVYKDNTDAQQLSLTGNELQITGGNKVDLSTYANTDAQNISFSGKSLSIDNGNSVDLSSLKDGYEANTDQQTLSISGTNLSISGGNTVDLKSVAVKGDDDQKLKLSGTRLSIEDGNTVDLSSLLEKIYQRLDEQDAKIAEQENTIAELEAEIAQLKSFHKKDINTSRKPVPILYQNYPNPTSGNTRINYFLPENVSKANLVIYDMRGYVHKNIPLNERGKGSVEISGSDLKTGQYMYVLQADGMRISTKKMVVVN